MPDDTELTPAQQAEAAYAANQRPAPHVAVRWHLDKGEMPNVPTLNGEYTAAQTAHYLTHAQYEAGLQAGILTRVEAPKAEAATRKAHAPKPTTEAAPPPEKEGDS